MDLHGPVDATNGDIDKFLDTLLKEQSDTEAFDRSINDIIHTWYSEPPGACIMGHVMKIALDKGANAMKVEDITRRLRLARLTMATRDLVSLISDHETLSECLNVVLNELEVMESFTVPGYAREILTWLTKDMISITCQGHQPHLDDGLSKNTTHHTSDTGPPEPFVDSARLAVIVGVLSYGAEKTDYITQCCHDSLPEQSGFQKAQYFPHKWVLQFKTVKHAKYAIRRPVRVGTRNYQIKCYIEPGATIAKAPNPKRSYFYMTVWHGGPPPSIEEEQVIKALVECFPNGRFSLRRQLRPSVGRKNTSHVK